MNIQKFSNNYNQPQFTARFPKSDLQKLVSETLEQANVQERIPRLYTSLEYLDSILPGKKLNVLNDFTTHQVPNSYGPILSRYTAIHNDEGKLFGVGNNALEAIENIFLKKKGKEITDISFNMPKSVYENLCWNNRNVKAEDIEKFALDIEA